MVFGRGGGGCPAGGGSAGGGTGEEWGGCVAVERLLSVSCAAVLSVRELVCGYAGVPVTAGVSFEVGPGEAVVLRGANGAGKSTVLRTAVGQQAPVSGERWLKGGPVVENSLAYRRAVSCLFDEDAFLPGVSVGHHLELVLRGHGVADAAVVAGEAVVEFGLGDLWIWDLRAKVVSAESVRLPGHKDRILQLALYSPPAGVPAGRHVPTSAFTASAATNGRPATASPRSTPSRFRPSWVRARWW